MDAPAIWKRLANEPINSPWWYDSKGEEVLRMSDAKYLITNDKIGSKRLRTIWKLVEEIVVDK